MTKLADRLRGRASYARSILPNQMYYGEDSARIDDGIADALDAAEKALAKASAMIVGEVPADVVAALSKLRGES